jgi:hypothetical protein
MLQEKRDHHRPHQTMIQKMQEAPRILLSWRSHLPRSHQWRKPLLLTRENGAAAVARHCEDREDDTAVLTGHHGRTGDPPPPPPQHHRDLGFGLGHPPLHPRPI